MPQLKSLKKRWTKARYLARFRRMIRRSLIRQAKAE